MTQSVDEFIDSYGASSEPERYARFWMMLHRMPAILQSDFSKWTQQYKLYCTWNGARYRAVFASRMGWIGLTRDFSSDRYQEQVSADECSDWSDKP